MKNNKSDIIKTLAMTLYLDKKYSIVEEKLKISEYKESQQLLDRIYNKIKKENDSGQNR